MPLNFQRSNAFNEEIAKLEANIDKGKNKQRLGRINQSLIKIELDPVGPDRVLSDLNPYFAAEAGGQVRVFYTYERTYNTIFLVWVNPVEFPHDTNNGQDNDPCYNEFKRLKNNNLLEKFVLQAVPATNQFNKSSDWLTSESIHCTFGRGHLISESVVACEKIGERHYSICHIDLHSSDVSLVGDLIENMVQNSSPYGITFSYELYRNLELANLIRDALLKNGFKLTIPDGELELWERS